MAEAKTSTVRVTDGIWTVAEAAAAAVGRAGVDRSVLTRAGLLLTAAVPADVLIEALDSAVLLRGWAARTDDDPR